MDERMTKKFKRRNRRHVIPRFESHAGYRLKRIISRSRNWPIKDCKINSNWRENGLAYILISRVQPNNRIVFGSYLVDIFCLGLKDTFCNADITQSEFESLVSKMYRIDPVVNCTSSLAHTIIYGGIEFAAKYGFTPHRDFNLSKYILEESTSIEKDESVEFGEDGQPLFIQGPYDDPNAVIRTLGDNKKQE